MITEEAQVSTYGGQKRTYGGESKCKFEVIMAKASSFGLTLQTFRTIIVQYQVNTGELHLWLSNGMLHYRP